MTKMSIRHACLHAVFVNCVCTEACAHYQRVHLTCMRIPHSMNVVCGWCRNFLWPFLSNGYEFPHFECALMSLWVSRNIPRARPRRDHIPLLITAHNYDTRVPVSHWGGRHWTYLWPAHNAVTAVYVYLKGHRVPTVRRPSCSYAISTCNPSRKTPCLSNVEKRQHAISC